MTRTFADKTTIDRPDWLPEQTWPFRIRTTTIDGIPIAYTDEGAGPVLLLVHDGMWSYVWGQVIERLRDRFRVITLDFPGSGLSPASDRPVGLEADSELLEGFIDELGLDALTLVAHDLGGPVGFGVAGRRPELIEGLVMVNTFAWPPHAASLRTMLRLMGSRPMTAFDVATNLIPRLSAGSFGVGRHLDPSGRAAFLGPLGDAGPRRRFHQMLGSVMHELDYLEEVEEALRTTLSDQPVLTIYGEKNDPFRFQTRFREYFPTAEEMVVPSGNHFPMCDDPDGFAQRVIQWHGQSV